MTAISTPNATQAVAEESSFTTVMGHVAQAFEALGALILVIGVLWALVLAAIAWRRSGSAGRAYTVLRQAFGGAVLLGLEILVAADLIRTVVVAPTVDNVLTLGLIVLIRTFLSFSLETEIDGVPPWRRATASGASTIRRATQSGLSQKEDLRPAAVEATPAGVRWPSDALAGVCGAAMETGMLRRTIAAGPTREDRPR
jgi:uncharacterized membrane protein